LVAQDSDHITHLIGPFRGDVRQKLQMSGAAAYFGKNQQHSNIGKNSSVQPWRTAAKIFINDEIFRKGEKSISSVAS